jgi:hypothetical protein
MDIIRFALAIIVALTMMSVFLLLVKNDLKKGEKINNQWLQSRLVIGIWKLSLFDQSDNVKR